MGVITHGTFYGHRSLRDGTIRVTIDLREMDAGRMTQLLSYVNQTIKVYLTTSNIKSEAVTPIDDMEIDQEGKSPSQRLRNVLYRYWEQTENDYSDFNMYYHWILDQIIQKYKDKLE